MGMKWLGVVYASILLVGNALGTAYILGLAVKNLWHEEGSIFLAILYATAGMYSATATKRMWALCKEESGT